MPSKILHRHSLCMGHGTYSRCFFGRSSLGTCHFAGAPRLRLGRKDPMGRGPLAVSQHKCCVVSHLASPRMLLRAGNQQDTESDTALNQTSSLPCPKRNHMVRAQAEVLPVRPHCVAPLSKLFRGLLLVLYGALACLLKLSLNLQLRWDVQS